MVHELTGHSVVNSISAGSQGTWQLCTQLGSSSSSLSICVAIVLPLRQSVNCVIVSSGFVGLPSFPLSKRCWQCLGEI